MTLPETTSITIRERILLLVAAAFTLVGICTLAISDPQSTGILILTFIVWAGAFAAAHILLARCLPNRDPLLLPAAALLSGLGLLFIGRLAANFLLRQITWLAVSTGALAAIVRLSHDLRWLRRFRYTWLFGGLALLAATLAVGVNPSGYGPRLWLGVFGIYFQPAELLKLLLIAYMASYLAERKDLILAAGHRIGRWRLPPLAYVGPLLAMFGLAIVLQAWQQDLGAAMLFFFTLLAMLYLATGQWGYVVAGLTLFLVVGVAGYYLSDKVALRVDSWLNPWPEAADRAFQIVQSLLAFGAGGVFGRGVGLGDPTYIPAVHTDFVFAAIAEELGLAGAVAVIALYGVVMLRGFRVAARAPRPFERFLAAGLTAGLVIQAWVIMSGNAKLAPIAGVTLPLISYGGSSILTSFIALALLLRISDQATSQPSNQPAFHRSLLRLTRVLAAALILLAATCGYWSIVRAEPLRAREDNPRRVLYEQHIVRGRILDRNGVVVADIEIAGDGTVARRYAVPGAAPAVGYASLRYGTGGIEAAFDAELRGEAERTVWQAAWDDLLHRPPQGQDVQLTIDVTLQTPAQRALEGHTGAVMLLDAASGEILAMASSPTFDPQQLDKSWDALREDPAAPLVNRATQGLYQPGTALQTIILAQVLEAGQADFARPIPDATVPVAVNGSWLACSSQPADPKSLADAYAAACAAPFARLGKGMGANGLAAAFDRWGLAGTPPALEIPTEAADWTADALTTTAALEREAIGQGNLTVSPLQMALVAGTLANDGTRPAPRLALRVEGAGGNWQDQTSIGEPHTVLSASDAAEILAAWTQYGNGISGHLGLAVAGQGQPPHAWFLGVGQRGNSRYAVAVLLEHPENPERAAEIGRMLLEAAQATATSAER
ncbi:MAG: FtsW/RodA/SpoVE family cell cycle protein [Anaerolineae bacterium]|nr:FtsW/RodA/SpoVE family cell cycle protein [Anaerolineae bacterium]